MSSHHSKSMSFRSTEQQSTDSWCISCLIYKCSNLLRWPMYQWFLCNMCQDLSSYLCLYLTSIIAYSDIITLIWEIYDFALKSTELSTTPSSNFTTPTPKFDFHFSFFTMKIEPLCWSGKNVSPCLIWTEYLLSKPNLLYQYHFVSSFNRSLAMLFLHLCSAPPFLGLTRKYQVY